MSRKQKWLPVGQIEYQIESIATAFRENIEIVSVLCIALILRVYTLGSKSLWLDEFYSVTIRAPLTGIAQFSAQDPHPPLYYYLLHYWVEIFGNSPIDVRLLSALFGVAAVFMMYKLGTEMVNTRVGLISAILIAVSPMYILYSRQARMYSLYVFLSISSFYFFSKVLKQKRGTADVAGYIIITVLLLYTHVFALWLVAAQNIYLLIHHQRITQEHNLSLKKWGGLQIDIGILFFPWLLRFINQVLSVIMTTEGKRADGFDISWITTPTPSSILHTFQVFSGLVKFYPFDQSANATVESSLMVLLIFTMVVVSVILRMGLKKMSKDQISVQNIHLCALWIGIPIIGTYIISYLIEPIYASRFLIAASGGLYLLVAIGISRFRSDVIQIVLIGLIVTGSLFSANVYYETDSREDWKGASNYIENNSGSNDVILIVRSFRDPVDYYFDQSHPDIFRYPDDIAINQKGESSIESNHNISVDIDEINAEYNQVWVVNLRYAEPTNLHSQLNVTQSLDRRRHFGIVTVSKFSTNNSSTDPEGPSLDSNRPLSN